MDKIEDVARRNIIALRKAKGYTIKNMAEKLNFKSQTSYQKIESGATALTIDKLIQISNILEVNYLELLGEEVPSEDIFMGNHLGTINRMVAEHFKTIAHLDLAYDEVVSIREYVNHLISIIAKLAIRGEHTIKNVEIKEFNKEWDELVQKINKTKSKSTYNQYISGDQIFEPILHMLVNLDLLIVQIESILDSEEVQNIKYQSTRDYQHLYK